MPRSRRLVRTVFPRALLLLAAAAVLLITIKDRYAPSLVPPELRAARSVIWVTAHPDDESFFFAPSVLNLLAPPHGADGALLCLSVGNHEGLGETRREELGVSCEALGIARGRCVALDVPTLPDDPNVWWETQAVEQAVREYVREWDVAAVISFDEYGVSGHANHRALSAALSDISRADPTFPPVYAVASTSLLAKYTSALLLPFTLLQRLLSTSPADSALFISSLSQYRATRRSFDAHQSQAVWFRSLFVSFSRYLWWIELRTVV
ncbi:hypothetical protein JCM10449v2_005964 [Rhodotorula kratochvilovae]